MPILRNDEKGRLGSKGVPGPEIDPLDELIVSEDFIETWRHLIVSELGPALILLATTMSKYVLGVFIYGCFLSCVLYGALWFDLNVWVVAGINVGVTFLFAWSGLRLGYETYVVLLTWAKEVTGEDWGSA